SRVLNDLRSKGCKVSSSAFYRHIQQYKTEFKRTYMRYETKPGEQGQFDWSPYTVMIEGKPIKVQVFCLILGCSRYRTYMYSLSQTQSSVFEALEEGLRRIGGVPERIQTDNHATLYIAKKKEWNPKYIQFASHYGFQPSRSEVRHPWSNHYASYCTSSILSVSFNSLDCKVRYFFFAHLSGRLSPGSSYSTIPLSLYSLLFKMPAFPHLFTVPEYTPI
ncbi:MAG: DDE-type integrase/transposase/recombinase, partial [Methanosarcinales archaeon]|nr:DDE-type integrase/transposase/recombinase [Methanosarcinales archaeon]